jgi:hypothetical protein
MPKEPIQSTPFALRTREERLAQVKVMGDVETKPSPLQELSIDQLDKLAANKIGTARSLVNYLLTFNHDEKQ